MCWLLVGSWSLALITLSAPEAVVNIMQKPRFYGIKSGRNVTIYCSTNATKPFNVEWYKADSSKPYPPTGKPTNQYNVSLRETSTSKTYSLLAIVKARIEDSGVYFCKINSEYGSGTEVKVMKHVNLKRAQHQSRMKDGLIIFQALMLAVCIAAAVLRKRTLSEQGDSLYEEPETDHIYEGLAIETCGGGLYEELSIYAQAEGTEAPWEKD
ncbi:B-cell antigen receptor complex-associated protein beta chain [Echeneis naucrates]|uniref:Ig-like domain-containing protein n=1 Tax=Echeneis naucrates TaxID=173247 RepID=A0A665WCZ5_ECHNA|nr:B-cell antigen receptor complex-associated protein beta chain [Echeneis naucrates]